MQKFITIGNLTKDCELTETPSGVSKCSFSIAVNRPTTRDGEKGVDYFSCTAWRSLGENIAKYCHKGSKVYLEGELRQRNYEDNQGVKRTVYDYQVSSCEFLTPKQSEQVEEGQPRRKPRLEPMDDFDDPF